MEQNLNPKVKNAKTTALRVSLRVKRETKRRVTAELTKINKKEFGRKVRIDELLGILLPMLTNAHIKSLQDGSMTNADRLEAQYGEFIKKYGAISKDDFLGRILTATSTVLQTSVDEKN